MIYARGMISLVVQRTEVWRRRFRVSECRVVSSSSLAKTVIRYAYDRIRWPLSMTPMNCQDETILRTYGGHIIRVPFSLEEVIGWLGP